MEHKWKKLFAYYKPYKGLFFSDMFFAIMGAGITLVIPLIVRYITNEVIMLDEPLPMIVKLGIVMLVLVAVECFCNYYIAYRGHIMGASIEHDMRNEIFAHYQKLSFTFFNNQKVGQLLSRVTSDLFDISELLHHGPEDIVISLIKFVGSFVILFSINPTLTLVAFAFIPVMIVYAFYFNKKMKAAFKENRAKIADINSQIEDSLSGIRVVKSFANEEMEIAKFERGNSRFVDTKRRSYWYMGGYHSGLGALTTMVTIAVLVAGAVMITNQSMNVADMVTFLLYINNFTEPVKKLINFTEQFQNGYSGYERFLEILDVEPDIKDADDAVEMGDVKGEIVFEDVSFRYKDGQETVLEDINLTVKAGEYVAIIGSSGGGKTTFCNLIPRFYDVDKGRILIDGQDIRHIKLASLRDHIGVVQQDVYLFAENIMENIRYGRPDATDEEVIEAAKRANAHEFIMALPNGYRTDIGQRGVKLSGGQKQRLSIARVFLKNPPILIFDEATSALDNENEKIVQESMEKLAKDRTTFVIAHRLTTIENAEKVLELKEKEVFMIEFRKPVLEDKELIESYIHRQNSRSCECTFANIYLWHRFYKVEYAIVEDTLVFKTVGDNPSFVFPMGRREHVKAAIDALMAYCDDIGKEYRMHIVTPEQFALLEEWYPDTFQIEYMRDSADYVYEAEKLANLSGRKYHGKKNHVNKFKKVYPEWSYESISDENVEECFQMALKWRNENGCEDDEEKIAEICVTLNALRLFNELELRGGLLRADGKIVAFSIGEPVTDDTFVVHIEKAFADVPGAYPMINQQFVIHETEGFTYINREEDLGEEGLRQAKTSYHPVFLVEKGIVTRKGGR